MPSNVGVPFFDFIDMLIAFALGASLIMLLAMLGNRDRRGVIMFAILIAIGIALLIARYTGATA